jgi:predicted P-loop ATPase
MLNASSGGNVIPFDIKLREAWQERCQKTLKGTLKSNLANALMALRFDPDLRDCYAYDEMLLAPVMLREIGLMGEVERPVEDVDVHLLQEWLQLNGMPDVSSKTASEALLTRAHECSFHPIRQYIGSLIWDGVPRLGTWLAAYLGAPLNKYCEHIGRMFLTSMVARIAEPGCQADHMMVLEGPQGILKSSAAQVLGGKWFSDALPEVSGDARAASQHMRGKWLIEVSEMHALKRTEATQLKSFLTRRKEIYLARFGRHESYEPRQGVFIGTTNESQYLKDPSGGRRFWPVQCGVSGRIDLDLLAANRDQLFAEARENYTNGGQWWPDQTFENELIKPQQAARLATDPWEPRILEYLLGKDRTTVREIARDALGFIDKELRGDISVRIAAVLQANGWVDKKDRGGRYWARTLRTSDFGEDT